MEDLNKVKAYQAAYKVKYLPLILLILTDTISSSIHFHSTGQGSMSSREELRDLFQVKVLSHSLNSNTHSKMIQSGKIYRVRTVSWQTFSYQISSKMMNIREKWIFSQFSFGDLYYVLVITKSRLVSSTISSKTVFKKQYLLTTKISNKASTKS